MVHDCASGGVPWKRAPVGVSRDATGSQHVIPRYPARLPMGPRRISRDPAGCQVRSHVPACSRGIPRGPMCSLVFPPGIPRNSTGFPSMRLPVGRSRGTFHDKQPRDSMVLPTGVSTGSHGIYWNLLRIHSYSSRTRVYYFTVSSCNTNDFLAAPIKPMNAMPSLKPYVRDPTLRCVRRDITTCFGCPLVIM